MPLPQHFETATLMINGRSYQLRNCRISNYGMTAERDAVMGFRGMRGMTAPRLTETVTLEAEVGESSGIDARDVTLAAAFSAPLRVTPTQAGLSVPAMTFSNEPPPEPITMATIEAAARSVQRDVDRNLVDLLEDDAHFRARITDHVMGRQATTWANSTLTAATGADLDALAAMYGVTRESGKAVLSQEHPILLFKEAGTPEPLKTALDWLLEDEGEAA